MKSNKITLSLIAAAVVFIMPFSVKAQTDVKLDPEFGGRVSVGLEKKIMKGLHISLEEEVRTSGGFGSLGRLQTTLGVKYKVHPNIKIGLGYMMINPYDSDSSAFSSMRHRFMFDVTGTLRLGDWNFSLKERFQLTHRTGDYNQYQNPANAMMLKSRIMAKYKGLEKFEPYAFVEMRNYLNAPVVVANYNGTYYLTDDNARTGEAGWFLEGFNGGYINRYRASLGVDIKFDKSNTLGIYLLADYVSDKVIDANAEGTKLKSYTKEKGFVGTIGAEYVFSF